MSTGSASITLTEGAAFWELAPVKRALNALFAASLSSVDFSLFRGGSLSTVFCLSLASVEMFDGQVKLDEADLPGLPIAWFSSVISGLEEAAGFFRNMAAKGLGSERKY